MALYVALAALSVTVKFHCVFPIITKTNKHSRTSSYTSGVIRDVSHKPW